MPKTAHKIPRADVVGSLLRPQYLLDARNALVDAPEAAKFTWKVSNEWVRGTNSRSSVSSPRSTPVRAGML